MNNNGRKKDHIVINLTQTPVFESDTELVFFDDIQLAQLWNKAKMGKLTTQEQLQLVNLARNNKHWLSKFEELLNLMSYKSSWRDKIQALLNEYNFGTTDEKVIVAAKAYLARNRAK